MVACDGCEPGDGENGLSLETRQAIGIGRERIRKELQRDITLEPRVSRPEYLAHAARAQRGNELVRT